jgi:hypothetical protein
VTRAAPTRCVRVSTCCVDSVVIIVKGTTRGSRTLSLRSYRPTRTPARDPSAGGNDSVACCPTTTEMQLDFDSFGFSHPAAASFLRSAVGSVPVSAPKTSMASMGLYGIPLLARAGLIFQTLALLRRTQTLPGIYDTLIGFPMLSAAIILVGMCSTFHELPCFHFRP